MTSPYANIYLALINRLQDQVPEIAYIDMDYGQLWHGERPKVAFPCVLVDFTDWSFSGYTGNTQQAEGKIIVTVATDPYSSSSNITPTPYKEAALYHFDFEQKVFKALEGYRPSLVNDDVDVLQNISNQLDRLTTHSDNRRAGLKVRVMAFSYGFTDYSAKEEVNFTTATPTITEELVFPT